MLLKLTFSCKVQHPCGRVTWWRYTQSLCHLSVPHLDDADAIVVSIMGTVALQLTDLKHDLTKIEKIQPFPTNETSIQTLDRSFGLPVLFMRVFSSQEATRQQKNNMEWVWLERSCDSWEGTGYPNDSRPRFPGQWWIFWSRKKIGRLFIKFCQRGVWGGGCWGWDP